MRWTESGTGVAVVILLTIMTMVSGAATPGLAATHTSSEAGPIVAQQTTSTPTNNTTVQHERPDNVSRVGDTQRVSAWLERRLAGRLQGSAIELSQGEYERARALLGDEYNSRLEQYVDVAGEIEGTSNEETAETFQETQDQQRTYSEAVQSYRETYQDYQRARRQGNTTAARQSGRELEATSEQVTQLNESLNRNYESIGNRTDVDTTGAQTAISNTTQNITAQQAEIRAQLFVETELTVETNGSSVAFNDPMAINGQVTTANGTAVANQPIRVTIFEQRYQTTTDETGAFTVTYRPTTLPVNATNVTVRYLPTTDSPYLGSTTNVSVDVSQVTPSLDVAVSPSQTAYRNRVDTTVTATVDGRPVSKLPLRAILGQSTANTTTNSSGQATLTQRVPANVPTGNSTLRVTHSREDLAIGPAATSASLSITRTETDLTINAASDNGRVDVRGRLQTVNGTGVDGQSVRIAVGESIQTATTNDTGWYQLTMENVSATESANVSAVPVTARFDGTGTNLGSSRVETTVTIAGGNGSGVFDVGGLGGGSGVGVPGLGPGGNDRLELALLVGGGLLMLAGLGLWLRGGESDTETGSTVTEQPAVTASSETPSLAQQWLAQARSALTENDSKGAIVAAYAAIREQLHRRTDIPDSLTHREFIAACAERFDTVEMQALEPLADAYERVTFQAASETSAATEAVDAARSILTDDEDSS
ncbi:hypothetical protein [Haloarcula nitratireducens]|uniref:DUF4129 domain-containing protein n=1 Tax=Haloarcula nitratireducens TaxID=2487749 RepID=A0AAW4PJ64_9EURY|nr:hypothetical protein [Halomicroarcula nitratireducens]MBX0297802.1 hypothetical protein [Halomicroarcula nitratireducens]